jgi:PAS domain S-box-containing protein
MNTEWDKYRQKIIGLGEQSSRKSYYPELQEKIDELEAAQRNLELLINNISDAILIHDREGRILSWNSQARKVFNCTEDEKHMATIQDLSSVEMSISTLTSIWDDVFRGKTRVIEWSFKQLHSKKRILMHVSINKTNWNGKPALVSVLRDFTEQKKYEHDLILAREKAEESDRLKSAFLANLSHEIRTPMNAIMGFTDFLRRTDLASDKRETYISIVHESGKHLLSILDDIIEISRIETGQISPNLTPVNIGNCIRELYETIKVTVPGDKKIKLELFENESGQAAFIQTDKVKICQILTNLVNNAIKYTEEGTVSISYDIINHGQAIEFVVADTGEGIDKKYHSIIFDRFSRLDSELSVKMGGSGLGLAISKAYVEMLGGSIKLESEPGKGSVFSFTLPLVRSGLVERPETIEQDSRIIPGNNELILIAEDDDSNFLFFSKLLTIQNYRILRARNGREAVDMVSQNNDISIVLMDIKMPVLNGIMALRLIRQIKPSMPVVAQTAHALPEEQKEIHAEGFDGYLTKPIDEIKLFGIIQQLLPK